MNAASPGPAKKKTSTFTILLALLGGGALLVAVAVAIGIYFVMSSPEGRGIVGVMGEAVKISAKAQKAPGTKELRSLGCQPAMVMNFDDFMRMVRPLDAGRPRGDPQFGEMVSCSAKLWGTPPSCDEVAARYVSAVGPRPRPFLAVVQQPGKKGCTILYDGSARPLEDMGAPPAPMPPPSDE